MLNRFAVISGRSVSILQTSKTLFFRSFSKTMGDQNKKVLSLDTINPNVRVMEYAVRGPIVARAGAIEKELQSSCLQLMMTGVQKPGQAGIMIPIPQYPLYTATIAEYNAAPVPYYLDEGNKWALNIPELERALAEGRKTSVPRAIVVINPGNPTGQVLSRKNIEEVIKFARREKLVILADEVYQHNTYEEGWDFHSFKKVLMGMPPEIKDTQELASFMSASKGYMGECGFRAGYCELVNFAPEVQAMLYKSISARLCSSVAGQAVMECIVNPPKKGEPSYENHMKERNQVLADLKTKADLVSKTFNSIEGIRCNSVMGAMYCFPQITLPPKACEAAKADGKKPDAFYCFQLLEQTGLCVVPGSGFGQKEGTWHFRTTILPPVETIKSVMEMFKDFHIKFMNKYK